MPTIKSRLVADYVYGRDLKLMQDYFKVIILLDGEVFHTKTFTLPELFDLGYWGYTYQAIADKVLLSVLEEWPTCDQTSTSELQYRKTIISSCGQLKVIESL
ncbi:DNA repair protein [Escherichia phage VEc3]|uniref:DNA repair protein n=1 Tax=Escherichia phage VEc3 TaxID=2783801 RepID=A0A2H4YDK2_9CAUD|nr:DNA repair protein [Escherichia phage VEc3]AUE22249.1 DNA repair protein [Escherichia phage VEc3]